MSDDKPPLFSAAALFAALAIGIVLFLLVGLVAGIVAALVAYLMVQVFWVRKQAGAPESAAPTPASAPDPARSLEEALERLVALNLRLRLQRIPLAVIHRTEGVIDRLMAIMPRVVAQMPDGELQWVVFRIADDYLPQRVIEPYLKLEPSQQKEADTVSSVESSLDGLEKELIEVEDLLNQQNTQAFDAKAKFLKHRFPG